LYLGATHVDGTVCGEREDYIMSPTGTNNVYPVFSQCSIEAIHKVLIEKKFVGCFKGAYWIIQRFLVHH
jgi:hypothetical protein